MNADSVTHVDPIRVVWSKKWQLLFFTLIVGSAAYIFGSFLPPVYQAKATVLSIPPSLDSAKNSSDALSMNSYRDLSMTAGFLQSVIDKFESENPNSSAIFYPEILEKMISIESSTGASLKNQTPSALITFKVTGNDPAVITKIANILTQLLTEASKKLRAKEIRTISQALQDQYNLTLESLLKLEKASVKIKSENGLPLVKANLETKLAVLQDSISDLAETNVELNKKKSELSTIEAQLLDPSLAAEKRFRSILEIKSFGTKVKLTSLSNIQILLTKRITQLELETSQLMRKVEQMTMKEKQLTREIKNLTNSFEILSNQMEENHISKSKKTSDIRLISKAIKPTIPSGPQKLKLTLVAAALGLLFAVTIALGKEHLDLTS